MDFAVFCVVAVGVLVLAVGLAAFGAWLLGHMACFSSEKDLAKDLFDQRGDV